MRRGRSPHKRHRTRSLAARRNAREGRRAPGRRLARCEGASRSKTTRPPCLLRAPSPFPMRVSVELLNQHLSNPGPRSPPPQVASLCHYGPGVVDSILEWSGVAPAAPLPLSVEGAQAVFAALRRFEAWFTALSAESPPSGFVRLKYIKQTTATIGGAGGKKEKGGKGARKKDKGGGAAAAGADAADGAEAGTAEAEAASVAGEGVAVRPVLRIYEDFTPLETSEPKV